MPWLLQRAGAGAAVTFVRAHEVDGFRVKPLGIHLEAYG
jgi:hypothetical protein